MITLRHFGPGDAAVLQQNLYRSSDIEEVSGLISKWNEGLVDGKYFEMFAVVDRNEIVGSVSLYEHSPSVVSIGPEIFEHERRKRFAFAAMGLEIELAAKKGYSIVLQQIRTDNMASIRLHEKLGFETDGYRYKNKKGHEVVIYLKCLKQSDFP